MKSDGVEWNGTVRDGMGRGEGGSVTSLFAAEGSPESGLYDVIFARHRHALEVESVRHGNICARDLKRERNTLHTFELGFAKEVKIDASWSIIGSIKN